MSTTALKKIKLSNHFTIGELIKSKTAETYGYKNLPDEKAQHNLKLLCEHCLEPLRKAVKRPIHIKSGYRCRPLNRLVGGVENSHHITGQAADISLSPVEDNDILWEACKKLQSWDQLIWEGNDPDDPAWIHISFIDADTNRNEILKATFSKSGVATYQPYA